MKLTLEEFSPDNADLVLSWRNSEEVRMNSLDDRIIDKDEHLSFIASICCRKDKKFFLFRVNDVPVSVMNLNLVDGGEAMYWGCYIGDGQKVMPGVFPLMIALCGKLAFQKYGCKRVVSDVLEHNSSPQKMNDYLGIKRSGQRKIRRSSGDDVLSIEYRLDASEWPHVESRLRSVLTKGQLSMLHEFDCDSV